MEFCKCFNTLRQVLFFFHWIFSWFSQSTSLQSPGLQSECPCTKVPLTWLRWFPGWYFFLIHHLSILSSSVYSLIDHTLQFLLSYWWVLTCCNWEARSQIPNCGGQMSIDLLLCSPRHWEVLRVDMPWSWIPRMPYIWKDTFPHSPDLDTTWKVIHRMA